MAEEKEEKKEEATDSEESTADASDEAKEEEKVEEAPAEEGGGDDEGEEVEVPEEFKALIEQVEQMSVLELNKLVKVLEKKFGVSAAAMAVAAPGAGAGGAAEEKSSFNVELTGFGDSKINVIKAVKTALGLGLKEAKDLVEAAPAMLKEGVPTEEAEEMKKAIEEAGGSVELK